MSRIGNKPVEISNGAQVEVKETLVTVKGPKGTLEREFSKDLNIEVVESTVVVTRKNEMKATKALHGLTRNLIANMITGVTKGFEKKLEIIGVGYRAQPNKNKINLTLGFSHPIEFVAPAGIEFSMDTELKNVVVVAGIDNQVVGEVAAKVRSFRKPEPYKGKGIRYLGEYVIRKAGKAAATAK
ncbi:MAG: 50S ribosomal protein L6 [Candidatus Peregrinibacteria bacterium]|nr:50S ribosomal protein L6 [Candidatus Peregrinibacteria bacterium]